MNHIFFHFCRRKKMTENDILNILNESEDDSGDDAGDFEDFSSDDTIKFKI
jgi:hypothetical protein